MQLLIIAFALILGTAPVQLRECPSVECDENNPCSTERCPRFIEPDCCPELVEGKCVARFFHRNRTELIDSDQCFINIELCGENTCERNMECKEVRIPCSEPGCDEQTISTVCEPRSICDSGVDCQTGQECRVVRQNNQTQYECVALEVCEDLECEPGMECRIIQRATDKKLIPQCMAIDREEDCSGMVCEEGSVCKVRSRKAKCIFPTDCKDLECGIGMVCEEFGGRNSRVRCAQECTSLQCLHGYQCLNRTIGNVFKVVCVPVTCPFRRPPQPPRSCEELECSRDEVCAVCEAGEGREPRARCQLKLPSEVPDSNNTSRSTGRSQSTERPRSIGRHSRRRCPMDRLDPERRPPMSCNELRCWRNETCQVFSSGNRRFAKCLSSDMPTECTAVQCDPGHICTVLQEFFINVAVCLPDEIQNLDRRIARRLAKDCKQLICDRDFECLHSRRQGRTFARCSRREQEDATCLTDSSDQRPVQLSATPQNFPNSCSQQECCAGERCFVHEQILFEDGIRTTNRIAFCARERPMENDTQVDRRPFTCEELECEEDYFCRDDRNQGRNDRDSGNRGRDNRGRGGRGRDHRGRGGRGRDDHGRGGRGIDDRGRGGRGRDDRGRGDHGRGDRGRGDHGRGDRGRDNRGRGDRDQNDRRRLGAICVRQRSRC